MIKIVAKRKDITKTAMIVTVDDEDADLAKLNWNVWNAGPGLFYFRRCCGNGRTELLHRVIWRRVHTGTHEPRLMTFSDGNHCNHRRSNIISKGYGGYVEFKPDKPKTEPARLPDDASLSDHHPCGRYAGLKSVSYKVCAKRANPGGLAGSLHILYPECVECPIGIAAREKWGPQREEYKSPPRLEMCR